MESIWKSMSQIVFPGICICCSGHLEEGEEHLCSFCRNERFEPDTGGFGEEQDPLSLPDGLQFRISLWKFDKGGTLQELLHSLKYERLIGLGTDLGRELGKMLIRESERGTIRLTVDPLLVPVPLYPARERRRGFNQARAIAAGSAEESGWELADEGVVRRIRHSRTQTGLRRDERLENINGVFRADPEFTELFRGRQAVVVDDVFTTGATSFELARLLLATGADSAGVATVARA